MKYLPFVFLFSLALVCVGCAFIPATGTPDVVLMSERGEIEKVFIEDLEFAYRTSPFQEANDDRIVARVELKLEKSERKLVQNQIKTMLCVKLERNRKPRNNLLSSYLGGLFIIPVAQDDALIGDQGETIEGNVLLDNGNGLDEDPDGVLCQYIQLIFVL